MHSLAPGICGAQGTGGHRLLNATYAPRAPNIKEHVSKLDFQQFAEPAGTFGAAKLHVSLQNHAVLRVALGTVSAPRS